MSALKGLVRMMISGDFWPVFDLALAPSRHSLIR
jgi:hypothetical protein